MYSSIVLLSLYVSVSFARKVTVENKCSYTIWPALYTDPKANGTAPDHKTGWEQQAGATEEFEVPEDWYSGRIWGRKDCDFGKDGLSACSTGNCKGGLECDKDSGTGLPPVTVAEFTLGNTTNGTPDNYDVSLVDGFNIPMQVTNSKSCHIADCTADINAKCPDELAVKGGTDNSSVVGCMTACTAFDEGKQDSKNCCRGQYDTPAKCPTSDIQYYDIFKGSCQNSYAYAYDESSGTALWTCELSEKADYTLTFCPSADGSQSVSAGPSGSAAPSAKASSPDSASASAKASASDLAAPPSASSKSGSAPAGSPSAAPSAAAASKSGPASSAATSA